MGWFGDTGHMNSNAVDSATLMASALVTLLPRLA